MADDIDDTGFNPEEFEAVDEPLDEDEGALDEAAEADREGAAAGETGEASTSYELKERMMLAADVFGEAALFEAALWLKSRYPDVVVTGIQSNAYLVVPGDVFVLHPWLLPEPVEQQVEAALAQGAVVVVVPKEAATGLTGVPQHVPLIRVDDEMDIGSRLAAAFYGAPSRDMVTVAVLGGAGKTTTSWLIRGVLEEVGQVVGMAGSIEHAVAEDRLDEDGHVWEPLEDDPSEGRECSVPFKLIPYRGRYEQHYAQRLPGINTQRLLAGMRDRGATVAVVECGADGLSLGSWSWLDVNVAVITNITPGAPAGASAAPPPPPSVSGLGQPQAAEQQEEAPDVRQLVGDFVAQLNDSRSQMLVLNADDPASPELLQRLGGRVPVVSFGIDNERADVWAERVKASIWETEVIVRTPSGRLQIITGLLGRHNVYNILAAVATGVALKAPLKDIVAGVEAVEVVPGRSEVIDEGQPFSVIVDAANTPEAMAAMLDAARQGGARQIFTVFGCSGDEDATVRPRMGAVAHAKSEYVILTNENPRDEDPAKIVQDIVAGFPDDLINRYSAYAYFPFQDQGRTPLWFEPYLQKTQRDNKRYVMEDRYSAIRAAIGTAGPDDVVLLLGKGHADWVEHLAEDGSLLKGWLDDRVEARNALVKLKYLEEIPKFNRDTLPWGPKLESMMESLVLDPRVMYRTGTEA